jgi:uncharacterized protein
MISVADLLVGKRVPGNYYAAETYVRGELEMGLLENRRGDRLMALPPSLIQGIFSGLEKETGSASRLVLFNCGRRWGKHFFNRFRDEITDYYGQALVDMTMAQFLQALRGCWATYGWGKLGFDQSYQAQGWLVIQTQNSAFARQAVAPKYPVCSLEAGVLAAFFSQLSGQELHCLQTSCESLGAEQNQFVIGLKERLEPAQIWVDQHMPHTEIINRLAML